MPLPIHKVNEQEQNNYSVDFSFLLQNNKEASNKVVTASDKDATLLMDIWTKGNKINATSYNISNFNINKNDFMKLKMNGLVSGDINSCNITTKGKKVITIMSLGENNSFIKTKKNKSYTEILASSKKTKKSGYRMPKTASSEKPNKACNIKTANGSLRLTKEEWELLGKKANWL